MALVSLISLIRRRRAVGVEVVDLFRCQAGVVERHLHGDARTLDRRLDHILTIGCHPVAAELGKYRRATRLRVLETFHDQDAGPFGQHRAIALFGEREAAFG